MTTLSEYIEEGREKLGSIAALAKHLDVTANSLTDAKRHQRGLPNHAVLKLARLTGHMFDNVLAASELITERKENRRKFWSSVGATRYLLALGLVTIFVTPHPADAAQTLKAPVTSLYYVN